MAETKKLKRLNMTLYFRQNSIFLFAIQVCVFCSYSQYNIQLFTIEHSTFYTIELFTQFNIQLFTQLNIQLFTEHSTFFEHPRNPI